MKKYPKLTLVGAGPGDPELITVKGVKRLAEADVVLYDSLVDPVLLSHAPKAKHILVGKRAGGPSVSQETINELIVKHALTSGHVVRLKGGDPLIFARGFEELSHASRYGIETEVIVGISSIMLAGLYGIPLTQRGVNQSFAAVTATNEHGQLSKDIANAAKYAPTALIFMGLGKLSKIVEAYRSEGRDDLPVAIISKGSVEGKAQVVLGNVSTIEAKRDALKPKAPALLVFGEGASHAQASSYMLENLQVA